MEISKGVTEQLRRARLPSVLCFRIPRRLCRGTLLESSHLGQVPASSYVSFNYLFGFRALLHVAGAIPDNLVIVLCVAFCNDATIDFRM